MCGIAGELNWKVQSHGERVNALIAGLTHRGPDDRGVWCSRNNVCVLGHARLSIVDLSLAAHQPMVDPVTNNVIVFNGEIYNYRSLRQSCETAGYIFKSQSDTEVILALYRRHGMDCLKFMRGMFALAIWDECRQQLFLARDRIGKKPLHYAVTPSGFVFCSELHPLSRHPGVDTTMDLDALDLYLQCQFIPAPWTIYRGIRKLPPAHYAVYSRAGLRITKYWKIDYRDKFRISEAEALDTFEAKLMEAVSLRMIADVPLGALLSGGVDSSLVVALMSKLSGHPVRTFAVGFKEEAFNELPWAHQAAVRCRSRHHPEIITGNVQQILPKLARHYGEPFADSSAVPSFFVSAAARRHVIVALNGDGGDELLGGYPRYRLPGSALRLSKFLGQLRAPTSIADMTPRLVAARTLPQRAFRKLLIQYVIPELRSTMMYAEFWNDSERSELLPDGRRELLPEWRCAWLEGAFAHADNPIDRMLWLDSHTYLTGDLLVKMDIASMHCGLEVRSPLLDHEVIEFCARLPVRYKVQNRIGKYLLKKLAERYFPADFVHRPKMGFGIPLAAWLRGPLRNTLREILLDEQIMEPLSGTVIRRTLQEFENGFTAHASRLWALFMFGHWRLQEESVQFAYTSRSFDKRMHVA